MFTQNEQVDSASLMFEEGAQNIIDNFARSMENLSVEELKFTLQSACEQLSFCAQLAELTPVIELCQSIQQHAEIIETENIKALCDEAIKSWRRTLALVMRGSLDKLPSSLDVSFMPLEENLVSWDEDDLSSLTDALDTVTTTNLFSPEETFDENDLSSLSDALDNLTSEEISLEEDLVTNNNREDTEELLIPEEELALLENALSEAISETTEEINTPVINQAKPTISKTSSRQTVRISTEQIEQLNNLFGKLILERNRVNSHLEQLKKLCGIDESTDE